MFATLMVVAQTDPLFEETAIDVAGKRIAFGNINDNTVHLGLSLNGLYFIQLFNRDGFFTIIKHYHEN